MNQVFQEDAGVWEKAAVNAVQIMQARLHYSMCWSVHGSAGSAQTSQATAFSGLILPSDSCQSCMSFLSLALSTCHFSGRNFMQLSGPWESFGYTKLERYIILIVIIAIEKERRCI